MDATTLPLGSFRGRAILHVVTRLPLRGIKERGAFDAAKSTPRQNENRKSLIQRVNRNRIEGVQETVVFFARGGGSEASCYDVARPGRRLARSRHPLCAPLNLRRSFVLSMLAFR